MKSVTLAAFNSRSEAEPVRQFLCESGIWAEIRADDSGDDLAAFDRPTSGVRLEVPREDFESALKLIYDWNSREASAGRTSSVPWLGPGGDRRSERPPGEPR